MIMKGVSKQVIEIKKPEDPCFERILLFLNPKESVDELLARKKADEYIRRITPKMKKRKVRLNPKFLLVLQLTAAATTGGIIAALVGK